jgi:hypothetical protein
MRKRWLVLPALAAGAALVLGLLAANHESLADDWHKVGSPDAGFYARMPGTPKEDDSVSETGIKTRFCRSGVNGRWYVASSDEFPRGFVAGAGDDLEVRYASGVTAIAQHLSTEKVHKRSWLIDGHEGWEYEISAAEPPTRHVGRMVLVGGRLYRLGVEGDNVRPSDPDVKKFLDSFKLAN